jgi:hypothetical protein
MNNRSVWVGFPAGADISIFFYVKYGKEVCFSAFSVNAYTASRRRKL